MSFDPLLEAQARHAQVVHHAERAHDKDDESWHKSNDATILPRPLHYELQFS